MPTWPAEIELLRDNLTAEIATRLGPEPVTVQSLKDAVIDSIPDAYMKTMQDCMQVTVDDSGLVSIWVPPLLRPDRVF